MEGMSASSLRFAAFLMSLTSQENKVVPNVKGVVMSVYFLCKPKLTVDFSGAMPGYLV